MTNRIKESSTRITPCPICGKESFRLQSGYRIVCENCKFVVDFKNLENTAKRIIKSNNLPKILLHPLTKMLKLIKDQLDKELTDEEKNTFIL